MTSPSLRAFHVPARHHVQTVTVDAAALGEAVAQLDRASAGFADWATQLPGLLAQLRQALDVLASALQPKTNGEPRVMDLTAAMRRGKR